MLNATNLNRVLGKVLNTELQQAAILIAHLAIMFSHGPSEVTPMEHEFSTASRKTTMYLARNIND